MTRIFTYLRLAGGHMAPMNNPATGFIQPSDNQAVNA